MYRRFSVPMDMTQEEKIVEGYLRVSDDKLLGMEANALRVLCEDYLKRARKDREVVEAMKQFHLNTPTHFIDRNADKDVILPIIINSFRCEMEEVTNYLSKDKRDIWDNAMCNLELRLKQIIK